MLVCLVAIERPSCNKLSSIPTVDNRNEQTIYSYIGLLIAVTSNVILSQTNQISYSCAGGNKLESY